MKVWLILTIIGIVLIAGCVNQIEYYTNQSYESQILLTECPSDFKDALKNNIEDSYQPYIDSKRPASEFASLGYVVPLGSLNGFEVCMGTSCGEVGGASMFSCHQGSSVGENVNLVYCDPTILPQAVFIKKLTDNQGNIIGEINAEFKGYVIDNNFTVVSMDLVCQNKG